MTVNLVLADILASQLEELIDRKAKISRIVNRKYEKMFSKNSTTTVVIRRFPNVEHGHGLAANAGGDITETDLTMQSEDYDLTELSDLNIRVKDVNKLISDISQEDNIANRSALRTALNHDAFVACLAAREAGTTLNDQSPATLTADTVEAFYTDAQTSLHNADVEETSQSQFINAAVLALTNQAPMHTGFDKSLIYKQVFNAGQVHGFNTNWSNNLPIKYTLTIGAAVTEDDFIKIRVPNAKSKSEGGVGYDEVVFTAKDVPSLPGEFDVAGSAAAQQTIINNMINGTGTPGATSYIELSTADRNILRRGYVNSQAFGTVNATKTGITARSGTTIVISLVSGSNVIADRSIILLSLDPKAIHFGELMQNFKIVGTESNNRAFADNVMWENTFGGKVTLENKARIVATEVTNGAAAST